MKWLTVPNRQVWSSYV